MKTGLLVLIFVCVFVVGTILMLAFIKFINVDLVENESCAMLGCSKYSKFVGSKNSDKFYSCDCHYAKQINSENIVCFNSENQAISAGYKGVDC